MKFDFVLFAFSGIFSLSAFAQTPPFSVDSNLVSSKLSRASALRACQIGLMQQLPLEDAIPVSIKEIKEKFPISVRNQTQMIAIESVQSVAKKSCPIMYGNLSEKAMSKFKAISDKLEPLKNLIPDKL